MNEIRVGLIGYGFAGKVFHAPVIRCVEGMKLTTFATTREAEVLADFPGAKICTPEQMVHDPEIDLVVVATPNDSHAPLAEAAMRAGKDVVVDKPFTVTLDEARALLKTAEETGRLLAVFHNRRWESEVIATKEILDSGVLGIVKQYECHMDRYRPKVRQRWRENPGPGAGLWYDLGPHLMDLAVYFFGLPNTVNANFGVLREGGLTDDWAHVQLNYDGLRVVLQASLLVACGGPRTQVHGTDGSWLKFGGDVQEAQMMSGMLPNEPGFGVDPSPGMLVYGVSGEKVETPAPVGNQMGYYEGVRDAILKKGPLPVPIRDALASMALLETTFKSGVEGRTLELPLTEAELALWA